MATKKKTPENEPQIRRRKITDYIPDMSNANAGTERGLQMVEDSLREDGVGRSIVADGQDRIPAGNKTLEAAMNAGITEVIEIETDGNALIVHKRKDWDLSDPLGAARRYGYRDNRASEVSLNWDHDQIITDLNLGVDLSSMFTEAELDILIADLDTGDSMDVGDGDNEGDEKARSDGSLLSLIDITIAEPKTEVERGDIFHLGHHILICCDVIAEWKLWIPHLKENTLFCPYPGVFVPLSVKAEDHPLVMVQPDKYIAGHICDQYKLIKGDSSVRKD